MNSLQTRFLLFFYRNVNWIETSTQFVPATGNQRTGAAGSETVSSNLPPTMRMKGIFLCTGWFGI